MNRTIKNTKQSGFGLVEIAVGSAILAIIFSSLFTFFNVTLPFVRMSNEITQANYILDEGIEVMKLLRDESWSTNIAPLVSGTPYALNFSADRWTITTGDDIIENKFHRDITISDVYRDGSDDITSSGTLDAGTKKITVSVEWFSNKSTTTKTLSTYITDIYAN